MILSAKNCLHLATKLAKYTHTGLLGYEVKRFADGEYYYRLQYVRKPKSVILLGNITPDPASIFELLALAEALADSCIGIQTLCVPYLGYSRQDRQSEKGEAVMAHLVAEMLNRIPAKKRVFVDLHSDTVRAMLSPHTEVFCLPLIVQQPLALGIDVVVAPDKGAQARAKRIAGDVPVITMLKHRPKHNIVERAPMSYPVKGKRVLMGDDMIDTGRTIASAAILLKRQGAKSITVAATHGIFSPPSDKILSSAPINKILAGDTLAPHVPPGGRVVSIARLLAEAL